MMEMIKILLIEKSDFKNYHMIIADLMLLVMEKIQQEPHIFDLLLAHANKRNESKSSSKNDTSDSTFVPLKITLFLLKQVNPVDKTGLFEKVIKIIKMITNLNRRVIDDIAEILTRKVDAIYS